MSASIKINGRIVPAGVVATLVQDDPCPGGASVEVSLEVGPHRRLFEGFVSRPRLKGFPHAGELNLTTKQSRKLVDVVGMFYLEPGVGPLSYFINKFTWARFGGAKVDLVGVASPVVRSRMSNGDEP